MNTNVVCGFISRRYPLDTNPSYYPWTWNTCKLIEKPKRFTGNSEYSNTTQHFGSHRAEIRRKKEPYLRFLQWGQFENEPSLFIVSEAQLTCQSLTCLMPRAGYVLWRESRSRSGHCSRLQRRTWALENGGLWVNL